MELLELDIELPYADHVFGTSVGERADITTIIRSYTEVLGPIAHMTQVHGDRIAYVSHAGVYEEADALYTDRTDVWLGVKTADCVPILVSSPKAVAAVHCGWRGLQQELLPKVLKKLSDTYDLSPSDLFIHIGPCICPDHYEVEGRFMELFDEEFFVPSENNDGHVMMDLVGITATQALDFGLPKTNINALGLCTFEEKDLFYSYRRSKAEGKNDYQVQMSLVKREG